MQVTLDIQNPQDWTLLLPLLERLGISIQEILPKVKQQDCPLKISLIIKRLLQKVAMLPTLAMRQSGNVNNDKKENYLF